MTAKKMGLTGNYGKEKWILLGIAHQKSIFSSAHSLCAQGDVMTTFKAPKRILRTLRGMLAPSTSFLFKCL